MNGGVREGLLMWQLNMNDCLEMGKECDNRQESFLLETLRGCARDSSVSEEFSSRITGSSFIMIILVPNSSLADRNTTLQNVMSPVGKTDELEGHHSPFMFV